MNAKEELLRILDGQGIVAATITYCPDYDVEIKIQLKVKHSLKEFYEFLDKLNFEYDSGYGTQHIFGTVWVTETEWLERDEYDGSESWAYMQYPEIPTHLK